MNQATLDKNSHLLNPGPNASQQQYWEAAAKFTNACCWDERDTYRMIGKDGYDACYNPQRPVVCDKVCSLHSGDVYDLVINGGTSHQSPSFNATGQHIEGNQFVHPYDPATDQSSTEPPPMENAGDDWPPYPGDQTFDVIGQALFDDYEEAHTAPNKGMSRWFGRCDYDTLTGIVPNASAAVDKHRPDWRRELGLPPKASAQG